MGDHVGLVGEEETPLPLREVVVRSVGLVTLLQIIRQDSSSLIKGQKFEVIRIWTQLLMLLLVKQRVVARRVGVHIDLGQLTSEVIEWDRSLNSFFLERHTMKVLFECM